MGTLPSKTARVAPAILLIAALSIVPFSRSLASTPPLGFAELRDSDGQLVGAASFQRVADGVEIRARFAGLPPGVHGYHVHAVGRCDAPSFMTAEGHFNPMVQEHLPLLEVPQPNQHGLRNPRGPHMGDLPNIVVAEDGTASLTAVARYATLAPGETSLFDHDGSALVIHADPDDEVSDPAGNSGARIACGVLTGGTARAVDGSQFVDEPTETQSSFRSAHGSYAPEQWALERSLAFEARQP
jgi:Cu-Zn family superoxide dismutase